MRLSAPATPCTASLFDNVGDPWHEMVDGSRYCYCPRRTTFAVDLAYDTDELLSLVNNRATAVLVAGTPRFVPHEGMAAESVRAGRDEFLVRGDALAARHGGEEDAHQSGGEICCCAAYAGIWFLEHTPGNQTVLVSCLVNVK